MRLSDFPEIFYAVSKKSNGNMSLIKGDIKKGLENRAKWLKSFGLSTNQIVSAKLEHKTKIINVNRQDLGKGGANMDKAFLADGLIVNQKKVFLFLLTADCLPISIYDPKNKAIGLIHASRMNLEKGIIKKTFEAFKKNYRSKHHDLIIKIGPSIGPCCYYQNLWKKTEGLLISLGVESENIENEKICSCCSDQYFSHRQAVSNSLSNDKRFATILGIKA